MLKLRALRVATMLWLACLWPQMAAAQTLTTFNSEAGYTAALPAPSVMTTVESFSTVTSDRLVSTGTPDVWTRFTLVATGTSQFGSSAYCVSLRACMNWTASPPAAPGVYIAVDDGLLGDGRLTFTPASGAIGFGLDYWDWNDGGQRSRIVVTLSNGAVFNVTGPTTLSGDPGRFIGFRIDQASVNAGISITRVVWRAEFLESEIVGVRNVRISTVNPLVVTNTNDAGAGSLRTAVNAANANLGPDTIAFAIPGAGPHTITMSTPLPPFLGAGDAIDGTTQPGASCGDLWAGTPPTLRVHLTAGAIGTGLHLEAANLTVRGLAITGFTTKVFLHPFASNVNIQCNSIGLLPNGTRGAGTSWGVLVEGAGTVIGGLNAGEGNVVSGNSVGVLTANGSSNTAVRGNFIGTNLAGMSAIANERGVNHLNGTGSWRDITRNLIAGNTFGEINIDGDDTVTASNGLIRIQRNVLGYNRTLSAKLQAGSRGAIRLESSSLSNVLIGGDTTQGNVIGALQSGIEIFNGSNITIQGNTIAGSSANGIRLGNVNGATIGSTSAGLANMIGGNGGSGILLEAGSANVTMLGNAIGIATIAGTTAGNAAHGIVLNNVSNVTIGDGTAGGRNVIGGNGQRAIFTSGTTAGIAINGNYIGTDATGNAAVANGWNEGGTVRDAIVFASAGTYSNIAVLDNVVGGYGGALIEVWSSTATGVTIQGNNLGVGANGVSPIVSGNVEELIHIGGATPGSYSDVLIGGSEPGQGNLLANGGRAGIFLFSNGTNIQVIGNTIRNNAAQGIRLLSPTRAAIISNRIFANGLIGIDLAVDGVTPNDPGDGDSGPNDLLNFPAAVRAVVTGPNTLQGSFTLDAPAADYRIEFFASSTADPSGHGEGERFLGHVDIFHPGGTGTTTGTLTTLEPVSIGDIISATTTRRTAGGAWDITSEFSAVATADGVAALTVAMASELFDPPADNPFATSGNDILLTTTVSNNGNGSTDADSLFMAVAVSPDLAFFNDVTPVLGGVAGFATAAPALTFTPGTDLRFSNSAAAPSSLAQCTYAPVAGYDPAVRHVCINPKGTLPSGAPQGQFTLQLRARIN